MSQAKVDRYKEQKANRKQIMKKEKLMNFFRKCVLALACVGIIAMLGVSAVRSYQASIPRETVSVDYTAIDEYLNTME